MRTMVLLLGDGLQPILYLRQGGQIIIMLLNT